MSTRWLPKGPKPHHPCMVKDCTQPSRGTTSIVQYAEAKAYLDLSETESNDPLALCNAHYYQLYRDINYPPCATCSILPIHCKRHTRKCPDPNAISEYLNNTIGFDSTLTEDCRICRTCYKLHCLILKQKKECPTLEFLISTFQKKLQAFQDAPSRQVTTDEFLDMLVVKTGLGLAKTIEKDEAILMPVLYSDFVKDLRNDPLNTSGQLINSPPTTNWLLNSIILHFKDTLGVVCKHKRYGTLVYRKGGDLLKALSKSLGTAKEASKKHADTHLELCIIKENQRQQENDTEKQIIQSSEH